MVRLLHKRIYAGQPVYHCFQSHNGSIATRRRPMFAFYPLAFNPTMVRLLRQISVLTSTASTFNPTMVRLLLSSPRPCLSPFSPFQSHNGSIATPLLCFQHFSHLRFQSHNGSIATSTTDEREVSCVILSIPQWFDCYLAEIWGFGSKTTKNGKGIAVDLRLPENS